MVAIFKRKGKAAKEAEKKDSEKPADEAPPKPAYKHVPTHAASDSVGQGSRLENKQDRNHIAIASRRRAANSMYDSTLGNAAYQQSIAHELAHGTPSPLTPYGSQPRYQDDLYYGDFDTPPTPGHPMMQGSSGQMRMSRQSSDYFVQSAHRGRSYESRGQGYGKGKEQGYVTPYYSDSGYESAGPPSGLPSRDPSLQDLQDLERQYMSRDNKGLLLPEPRLSDDFSNMSINMAQLEVAETVAVPRKSQEGVLKNIGNVSPLDLDADSRSTKSTTSVSKRTRFEDDPEPMPELNRLEHHREAASALERTTSQEQSEEQSEEIKQLVVKPEDLPEPPVDSARASPVESDAEIEEAESSPVEAENKTAQIEPTANKEQQETKEVAPAPSSTQAVSEPSRRSMSNDAAQRPTLQRISSAPSQRRMTLPPLAILDGLKVNKKGLILDEEGDPIGQLVDGELLDCVRQKANAVGEVLDEYGRMVGTVRTIPAGADMSPVVASRPNTSQSAGQARAQSGRPQLVFHTRSESAVPRPAQRKSIQTSPEDAGSESVSRDFAEAPRRAAPRTASERSLAELSKPFARPAMTSVPENNVPEDDATPDSPGLYAFKGDLPVDDQPQQDARMRSRSPPTQIHPSARPALAGGHPYSQMYAPMMTSQIYPGGRMGPRRATTQVTAYGAMNSGLGPRMPTATHPARRTPISSHESSPLRSDAGFDLMDGGRPTMGHSRANSINSAAGHVNKPRTYFTHGGKVTVDPNAPKPEKEAEKTEEAAPAAEEKKPEKKKRFSVGFGKKDKKDK